MNDRSKPPEREDSPRGYFLSIEDGEELRRIGEAAGVSFDSWLADRNRTSFVRRMEQQDEWHDRACTLHDSTYAHLRAVIENCKTATAEAIRHQLVGLLPETREMEPEVAARMREHGLGHLVDLQEQRVQANWAEYGYGEKQA